MKPAPRRWANRAVGIAAPIVFLLAVVGAVVSLVAQWPHQFGGVGSREHILTDFVTSGTATAPPLFILVVLGVVAFAARRGDRWGTAALILLLPLAVLTGIGTMGEALAPPTPDVPRAVQLLIGAYGLIAGVVLFILAVVALWERRRPGA